MVPSNYGTVPSNYGTVPSNYGTVPSNYGTVPSTLQITEMYKVIFNPMSWCTILCNSELKLYKMERLPITA